MALPPDGGNHFQFRATISSATTTEIVPAIAKWSPSSDPSRLDAESAGATTGTSTITKTSAGNWTVDQWIGYLLRINSGDDVGSTYVIADNDATTLTLATNLAADVDIGDVFEIWTPSGYTPVIRTILLSGAASTAGTLTFQSTDGANVNADMPIITVPTAGLSPVAPITGVLIAGIINGNVQAVSSTTQAVQVFVEGEYVMGQARNVA